MGKLLLLFIALPIVDLWVLLRIGRAIGFWPAVGLVLVTGVAGAWLARAEGFRVLRSWHESLAAGRLPEEGVLSGVLILVGAAFLLSPGVITDVLGLALLFPPTRRLVAAGVRRRIGRQVNAGRVRVFTFGVPGPGAPHREPSDDAIDVTPRRD